MKLITETPGLEIPQTLVAKVKNHKYYGRWPNWGEHVLTPGVVLLHENYRQDGETRDWKRLKLEIQKAVSMYNRRTFNSLPSSSSSPVDTSLPKLPKTGTSLRRTNTNRTHSPL
jgi:hypothetical protein